MARRRHRLDEELVCQGLCASVDEAARCIMAGEVSTDGRRFSFPGEQVEVGLSLHVRSHAAYVSRGGLKLEHGLDVLGVDVDGANCLDIGCSTGGFTDCLLRHGAAHVVSVDVGYAQFSWSLRNDERVTLLERTNIVDVVGSDFDASFDVAVCDVSFTSVQTILPAVTALLAVGGSFLTLVKPQFEAARADVGVGGIVRDEAVRRATLETLMQAFEQAGFVQLRSCESPIVGHKGNIEYLLAAELHCPSKTIDA